MPSSLDGVTQAAQVSAHGRAGTGFPRGRGTSGLWVPGTNCARSISVPGVSSGTWSTGTGVTDLLHVTAGTAERAGFGDLMKAGVS